MKLAEALSIRADLQRRINQLRTRLKDSSKVQEGDLPAEQLTDLFQELDACLVQWEDMVFRINQTNIKTLYEGKSITRMIARKDRLAQRVAINQELLKHVMETERYGRNEIRYVRQVDVTALRKETDCFAKELRELDLKLQELNWAVDLLS
ncbi:MAG: DIP1984 family protein [Prevotellamassilia sp.]